MNRVKCQACGEISCVVIPRRKLTKHFGIGAAMVMPAIITAISNLVRDGLKFFDRKYLHCEKCGDLRELP